MLVFRIEREKYIETSLSGTGAALTEGNRWNSFGTRMVYTSQSRALALLEVAVHLDLLEDLPNDRFLLEIEIPDHLDVATPEWKELPKGWNEVPATDASRLFGDAFVSSGISPVMRVPSILVPKEFNFLINPAHPLAKKIQINMSERLRFDPRLK